MYFIFLTRVTHATNLTFPHFFQTKIILLPVEIVKLHMGEVAEGRSILRPSATSPTLWSKYVSCILFVDAFNISPSL